jgi:predicted 2-oxoglutarate/Fe(II)-dependent dioxygenase YbiX
VGEVLPGMRHFWDFDGSVSRLYGALPAAPAGTGPGEFRRMWVVLDPALRVLAVIPFQQDGGERAELIPLLRSLPPVSHYGGIEMHAPILMLPNVLEPELCRRLVAEYERGGGELSGFMRQVDGKTLRLHDGRHKRRRDLTLEDAELQRVLQQRVISKVVPIIRRVHAFEATRMERYIVGCYDAEDAAHFAPHRDNTTSATAHRRFALSVNLNDDFDGGELCFPEYGPRRYKMPAGGAIVFSGSLLHAVTQVRKGRRYAFLPFLYDEAAAALRERNNAFLGEGIGAYQRMPADPRAAVEAPQSVF